MNYKKFTKEELVELLAIHTETFTRLLHEGKSGFEYEESKRAVNELVSQIRLIEKTSKEPLQNNDDQPQGVKVNSSLRSIEKTPPTTGNSTD